MHPETRKRLLAAQPDTGEHPQALDEARLRQALTGTVELSPAEQALLLHDPSARQRLYALRDAQRARQYLIWKRLGMATQVSYLAAADVTDHPVTIDTHPHLTVKVFPLDAEGTRWTIFLKVSETLQETLLSGLRLLDSGGLLWLIGQVDADGELSMDWAHAESPLQRLHHYELRIEPR